MANVDVAEILELLCSPKKLERDRAIPSLEKYLQEAKAKEIESLGDTFIRNAENSDASWEIRNSSMLGSKCLLAHMHSDEKYCEEFAMGIRILALRLLTDDEVRVRMAAGEVLGVLCIKFGPTIYAQSRDVVLNLIRTNLSREMSNSNMDCAESNKCSCESRMTDATQIFHDTAGWKFLETSMKALQSMVDGCGQQFEEFVTQELIDLIFESLSHANRFVRETGFGVLSSLICGCTLDRTHEGACTSLTESSPILRFGHLFSHHLGIGLMDNWSQVRLAAAVATRKFLATVGEDTKHVFYPELIPKLCLNRYYLAEGVRNYSQETWRQIAGTEGKELVRKYIQNVVDHYVEQTQVENHAVREASCSCISELAVKIDSDAVRPFVPRLLETLIVCFGDDSWPVRDSACLACGNFVLSFPEESKSSLETLFPLFFANLEDPITSVRQGAAAALANVVRAYGLHVVTTVVNKVREGLSNVKNQQAESEKYADIEKGPATFGVVKRLRDNDMDLHTNQTMYSCGSLAPKMGRSCSSGGCMSGMNRTFRSAPQPWELADGSIYLVSELAALPIVKAEMTSLLELMAKAAHIRHYTHHVNLLETLCHQLPTIAEGIGKREFKAHLDLFLEPIFYSLNLENALTSSAASQCLNQLSTLLGPNILRTRVELFQPS
uniref:TOG domain-containing protein n=1 Tax=Strigamia maritima TaxID=126957 RepID=T1JGS2_STRMM